MLVPAHHKTTKSSLSSASNSPSQLHTENRASSFVDNRPESVSQQQTQAIINHSSYPGRADVFQFSDTRKEAVQLKKLQESINPLQKKSSPNKTIQQNKGLPAIGGGPNPPPGPIDLLGDIARLSAAVRPMIQGILQAVREGNLQINLVQRDQLIELLRIVALDLANPAPDAGALPMIPLSLVVSGIIGTDVSPFLNGVDIFLPGDFFMRDRNAAPAEMDDQLALLPEQEQMEGGHAGYPDIRVFMNGLGAQGFDLDALRAFNMEGLFDQATGPAEPLALMAPELIASPETEIELSQPERTVQQIHSNGCPGYRTNEDIIQLVSLFPLMEAQELLTLLRLPASRSINNLKYLINGTPLHRSLGFVVGLAARFPNLSIKNVLRFSNLPVHRDGDIPALERGRPKALTIERYLMIIAGLPARNATDLVQLSSLGSEISIPDIITIGGAPGYRSGLELATLVRGSNALPILQTLAVASIPEDRSGEELVQLCSAVSPARPLANLIYLASNLPDCTISHLNPVAELVNLAALPLANVTATVEVLNDYEELLVNANQAYAALNAGLMNFRPPRICRMVEARPIDQFADLMTILQWQHYADYNNMRTIVCHDKVDSTERLVSWLTHSTVNQPNCGNLLSTILSNRKIEGGQDVSYLLFVNPGLERYSPNQVLQWLARRSATREGDNKTTINGSILLSEIPGTGSTAGQRYSPDIGSPALGGHYIHHLSMSFSNPARQRGARRITFTGFHVTWRLRGAKEQTGEARVWFSVNNGLVAFSHKSGYLPRKVTAAMEIEARRLMRNYLPRLNCYGNI